MLGNNSSSVKSSARQKKSMRLPFFGCGLFLSIYLSSLSRSFSDYHLRCDGWLNLEFSKRENIQDGPLKLFTRSRSEAC